MACYQQSMFCCRNHHRIIFFLLFLSVLSFTHFSLLAQGRDNPKLETTQRRNEGNEVKVRSLIGSRPPRCEKKCRNCGQCVAVQVPIDPVSKHHLTRSYQFNSLPTVIAYSSGEDSNNYKPLCWKCKCGSYIFNP